MLQWKGPYKVVEILNEIDYRIDVNDVVGTYYAKFLKLYVLSQSTSCQSLYVTRVGWES